MRPFDGCPLDHHIEGGILSGGTNEALRSGDRDVDWSASLGSVLNITTLLKVFESCICQCTEFLKERCIVRLEVEA